MSGNSRFKIFTNPSIEKMPKDVGKEFLQKIGAAHDGCGWRGAENGYWRAVFSNGMPESEILALPKRYSDIVTGAERDR